MPHVELRAPIHREVDFEVVPAFFGMPLRLPRHLDPPDERAEDFGREHMDVEVFYGVRDELPDQAANSGAKAPSASLPAVCTIFSLISVFLPDLLIVC